jgi:hypothetical protein
MPLAPGTRLGSYEIVAPLGAGGMGEVFRARDPRLKRDIAIKVLPADVSSSPDRLGRFEREATTVAGLNHANIVVLHSIEEDGGIRFLINGTGGRAEPGRARHPGRAGATAASRSRDPACRRHGRGAREGRCALRPQTRECDGHARAAHQPAAVTC